jgi:hypothetical protein
LDVPEPPGAPTIPARLVLSRVEVELTTLILLNVPVPGPVPEGTAAPVVDNPVPTFVPWDRLDADFTPEYIPGRRPRVWVEPGAPSGPWTPEPGLTSFLADELATPDLGIIDVEAVDEATDARLELEPRKLWLDELFIPLVAPLPGAALLTTGCGLRACPAAASRDWLEPGEGAGGGAAFGAPRAEGEVGMVAIPDWTAVARAGDMEVGWL